MCLREGDNVLDALMKHHECLNHPLLRVLHSLAEEGNAHKFILEIKSAPACPSCLFLKAYRELWRTKSDDSHIKSNANHVTMIM